MEQGPTLFTAPPSPDLQEDSADPANLDGSQWHDAMSATAMINDDCYRPRLRVHIPTRLRTRWGVRVRAWSHALIMKTGWLVAALPLAAKLLVSISFISDSFLLPWRHFFDPRGTRGRGAQSSDETS